MGASHSIAACGGISKAAPHYVPPPALVVVLGGNPVTSISVFACLNAADTRALRRLHPAVKAAVAGVPWADTETPVADVVRWRAALPGATGAAVSPLLEAYTLPQFEAALAGLTQLCLIGNGSSAWDDALRRLPSTLRVLKVSVMPRQPSLDITGVVSVDTLAHLTSLVSLECHGVAIVVDGLPPALRELHMVSCQYRYVNHQDTFQHLRGLPVRTFVCVGGYLSNEVVDSLPPTLQTLDITNVYSLSRVMALAHLPKLTECCVPQCGFDDAALASLSATIVKLDVAYCKELSRDASFGHLSALRELDVHFSGIGDATLTSLPPSLTSLLAKYCSGFTPAAVFPTLPALRVLDVSNTNIGDATIASMPASLTTGTLRMTVCPRVTCAATLEHLPALRELHCWGTTLSPAVVRACRARGCATSVEDCVLPTSASAWAPLPDGRLAFTDKCGLLHVWNAEGDGKPTRLATGESGGHSRVYTMAAMPDGRRLAKAMDCHVEVWDVTTSPPTRSATVSCASSMAALAALRDGRLVAGCSNCTVEVVDVSAGAGVVAAVLAGHTGCVAALAELHDGSLASGSLDGTVRVWDMATYVCIATLADHAGTVPSLAVLADGRLACGTGGREVQLWDARTRTSAGVLARQTRRVNALAALPDGRLACASTTGGAIWLWDTRPAAAAAATRPAGAAPMYVIGCYDASTLRLVALPDGRLASMGGGEVHVWLPPPPTPT